MKTPIKKFTESELLGKYPIKSNIIGWYFRADEISNNVYLIKGSDQFGRTISLQGQDYEELLKDAELQAEKISSAK